MFYLEICMFVVQLLLILHGNKLLLENYNNLVWDYKNEFTRADDVYMYILCINI